MRHDAPITCDFCDEKIDTDVPWTSIDAVVPKDIAEEAKAENERRMKLAMPAGFLGLQMPVRTPTHFKVDICPTCENKRVPDLRPLVALRIQQLLDKVRERAAEPGATPHFRQAD